VSFNNSLPADWLIATPKGSFGSYTDLEMALGDETATNDFKLKEKVPDEEPDSHHPALPTISSVTSPGQAPLILHEGHSRAIYEQIYRVIVSATRIVDIITMGLPQR